LSYDYVVEGLLVYVLDFESLFGVKLKLLLFVVSLAMLLFIIEPSIFDSLYLLP